MKPLDRCWANDMIFKATSAVLGIDIAVVDEREPHDRVQIALRAEAETPGLVIPTRSWRGELLPRLLQQQREFAASGRVPATPLIVLHWVTNRQHYEPALPIEPPETLPSPPRSPASRATSTDDGMNPGGDEQPEGHDRPPMTSAAHRVTKAPATRSTTRRMGLLPSGLAAQQKSASRSAPKKKIGIRVVFKNTGVDRVVRLRCVREQRSRTVREHVRSPFVRGSRRRGHRSCCVRVRSPFVRGRCLYEQNVREPFVIVREH